MEALESLEAEIVEGPLDQDAFIAVARDADAMYAKGMRITKKIIDGLERCRVISLGTVGVDSVDVAAAPARGIPVTNGPIARASAEVPAQIPIAVPRSRGGKVAAMIESVAGFMSAAPAPCRT